MNMSRSTRIIGPEKVMMDNPAPFIDHTLLKPETTEQQISVLCEEAVEYGFASACLPPAFVSQAVDHLYGSEVKVCSVIGFPCGYNSLRQKVNETSGLAAQGAQELDMVISVGQLLERHFNKMEEEIAQVVIAAGGATVKVIIECCYLSPELMQRATDIVCKAGAGFVKTSTGFGPYGAKVEDVRLLAQTAAGRIGVKAAGGIRDLTSLQEMLTAGATRIGSSAGVAIFQEWQARLGR